MTLKEALGWVDIGPAGDITDGEARSFSVDGTKICVIRRGNEFFALGDLCSHGHAFLSEGYCDTSDCVIECPLHGGLFDIRTGAAVGAPAEKDQPVFEIKVEADRLLLHVKTKGS